MAEDDNQQSAVLDSEDSNEDFSETKNTFQSKTVPNILPIVGIGQLFQNDDVFVKVDNVSSVSYESGKSSGRVVEAKSKVFISGGGLENFDKVVLRLQGNTYSPIDLKFVHREISFFIPDFDKLFSSGSDIILEFYSRKFPPQKEF